MSIITSLDNFLIYLRLHKGRSMRTLEQYAFHIWRFIKWLEPKTVKNLPEGVNHFTFLPQSSEKNLERRAMIRELQVFFPIEIESIKKDDIDAWRLDLADSGLSVKTVNAHIITMRSWFKYLKKEGIQSIDPTSLDLMKAADREVTFLTNEEIERFFAIIDQEDIQGVRDFAICECIYSTGLRISELTNLNRNDVNLETMEFAVRGKGNKLRTVYLTETARDAIRKYLDKRDDFFSPLFIRHNFSIENINSSLLDDEKVRLTRFFITNMVKDYGLKAGILKNLHAHTLRHSFATTLLTNGADIRIIQELLGHASITTTQVYTHVTNPKLKEAHQKFHK
ncbi:MAG: tyrosine-type recombinase/integrase [Candidatus Gracilibacteria bacterium]|nr:tyrosine-type recombinase/integrase [Candidatus Gracilibacteria bacterium]